MNEDSRQYLGMLGMINSEVDLQVDKGFDEFPFLIMEAQSKDSVAVKETSSDEDSDDARSLDSLGKKMYKSNRKIGRLEDGPDNQSDSQIFMVQHFNDEHHALIQLIRNNSRSLGC